MRLVVSMSVVAALAWTIPAVFFGRETGEHAIVVAGDEDEPPAGELAGLAPVDPIGMANDTRAQAGLNDAVRVAQVYFAEHGTFEGFGPLVGSGYAPTLTFTSGPAEPGVVSIRGLSATTIVLVTATEGGGYLCAAAESEVVSFGRSDALAPAECAGGWA